MLLSKLRITKNHINYFRRSRQWMQKNENWVLWFFAIVSIASFYYPVSFN